MYVIYAIDDVIDAAESFQENESNVDRVCNAVFLSKAYAIECIEIQCYSEMRFRFHSTKNPTEILVKQQPERILGYVKEIRTGIDDKPFEVYHLVAFAEEVEVGDSEDV